MTLTYKYWHGGDWCGIYLCIPVLNLQSHKFSINCDYWNCIGSSVIRNKTVVLEFLTMTSVSFKTATKIICLRLSYINIEISKFIKIRIKCPRDWHSLWLTGKIWKSGNVKDWKINKTWHCVLIPLEYKRFAFTNWIIITPNTEHLICRYSRSLRCDWRKKVIIKHGH